MTGAFPHQDQSSQTGHDTKEDNKSLWVLAASPAIWAVHLLASYATAAVFCAKVGRAAGTAEAQAPFTPVRIAIAVFTAVALAAIAWFGWRGWRRHRLGLRATPHDADTPEDRYRFLGFATVLLSGLSAVAVIYAALAAVFIRSCR